MVPTIGAVGTVGAGLIVPDVEEADVQVPLLTVKVYDPGAKPEIVVVVPVPVADPEGVPVTVQVPDEGKPLKAMLPVPTLHVG